MVADDLIRYDVLVQDALRGVVRKVMREVADGGLPGEHHFYVAFDTTAPGVRMSSRLRQQHPQEMTIVLQHQFWDLAVSEHGFEVGLSFGGVPERLLVPFAAVKGVFDTSVQFGLQFDPANNAQHGPVEAGDANAVPALPIRADEEAQDRPADGEPEPDAEPSKEGAEVVSLDAFRKKP